MYNTITLLEMPPPCRLASLSRSSSHTARSRGTAASHVAIGVVPLEESINVVCIPISRNYTTRDCLKETSHLPGRSATLRVADQTLLCRDGHGIAGSTIAFA